MGWVEYFEGADVTWDVAETKSRGDTHDVGMSIRLGEGSSKPAWQQDEGTLLFRNNGLKVAVNPNGTVVSVMGQLK